MGNPLTLNCRIEHALLKGAQNQKAQTMRAQNQEDFASLTKNAKDAKPSKYSYDYYKKSFHKFVTVSKMYLSKSFLYFHQTHSKDFPQ